MSNVGTGELSCDACLPDEVGEVGEEEAVPADEKGSEEAEGSAMDAALARGFLFFFLLMVKEAQVSPAAEGLESGTDVLGAVTDPGSGGLLSGSYSDELDAEREDWEEDGVSRDAIPAS